MPQIQNIKMSFLSDRKPSTVKGIRYSIQAQKSPQ